MNKSGLKELINLFLNFLFINYYSFKRIIGEEIKIMYNCRYKIH